MSVDTNTALRPEVVQQLQTLIQVNLDSRDGLLEAADHVRDSSVAHLFHKLAAERNQQASELRSIVAMDGEGPASEGSYAAAAHRGWIELQAALGGGVAAMLAEAERGEDRIKNQYAAALDDLSESPIAAVLRRQNTAVLSAHDRIRDLRDSYRD